MQDIIGVLITVLCLVLVLVMFNNLFEYNMKGEVSSVPPIKMEEIKKLMLIVALKGI